MFVACELLFVFVVLRCLLFVDCGLFFVVCSLLFVVLLFVVCVRVLSVVCCFCLLVFDCSCLRLFVVCCMVLFVGRLLFSVSRLCLLLLFYHVGCLMSLVR